MEFWWFIYKFKENNIRYRTLDTTNPKVVERLVGFEGVLDFLMLLGFESDEMGMKLICEQKPSQQVVRNAVDVLNSYENRLGIGKNNKNNKNNKTPQQPKEQPNNNNENESEEDTLTLEQIILWSTHESMRDNESMETLITTHKTITDSSVTLLKQLRRRFFVPIPRDLIQNGTEKDINNFKFNVQKSIQLKVINALRNWLKCYWDEDFSIKYSENGQEMQTELGLWIGELDKIAQNDKQIAAVRDLVVKEFERFKLEGNKSKNEHIKRIKLEFDINDLFGLLDTLFPFAATDNITDVQDLIINKYSEAKKLLEDILLINPDYFLYNAKYALVLHRLKMYKLAEKYFRKAIAIDPTNSISRGVYGGMLFQLKRYDEAEQELKVCLAINPNNWICHQDYARLLEYKNDLKQAAFHSKKAFEINPSDHESYQRYQYLLKKIEKEKGHGHGHGHGHRHAHDQRMDINSSECGSDSGNKYNSRVNNIQVNKNSNSHNSIGSIASTQSPNSNGLHSPRSGYGTGSNFALSPTRTIISVSSTNNNNNG